MSSKPRTPRASTRRTPAKAKKAEPAVDVNDPNIAAALAVAVVAVAGVALGGAVPTTLGGALNLLTLDGLNATLHAKWWPFSLLLTLHVLNSVKSNNKWWVNDVVNCCFTAFGGLLIQDALQGNFAMPALFANGEAHFSLVLVCWYFVNHDIPMTDFNLYQTLTGFLGNFLPLDKVMDLCTVVYDASILIAVAGAGAGTSSWALVPLALGKITLMCIIVHCSSQFYTYKGLGLNVGSACSARAQEAVCVAFWYGTNGLAAFPFVGPTLAAGTGAAEAFFGGRNAFVLTLFVLVELLGHLNPVSLSVVSNTVHSFLGLRQR
jgi:hypothetical protein